MCYIHDAGDACGVCGNARVKVSQLSYHHFPSDLKKRALWLKVFQLTEEQFKPHHLIEYVLDMSVMAILIKGPTLVLESVLLLQ